MSPRITLEQWQALVSVVDAGGYAQAAEQLHKSQSSVTYLGAKARVAPRREGIRDHRDRKAVLTATGQLLYRRLARCSTKPSAWRRRRERFGRLGGGDSQSPRKMIFPAWVLLKCFDKLNAESAHTRIEYYETVIAGTNEALLSGRADLAITPVVPRGSPARRSCRCACCSSRIPGIRCTSSAARSPCATCASTASSWCARPMRCGRRRRWSRRRSAGR